MILRLFLLFILFFSVSSLADTTPKPLVWLPVFVPNAENIEFYYSKESIYPIDFSSNREFRIGSILVTYKNPEIFKTEKGIKYIKSFVTVVLINCDSRNLLPVYRLYYNTKTPNRLDLPVATREFEPMSDYIITADKKSMIYQTLCPVIV